MGLRKWGNFSYPRSPGDYVSTGLTCLAMGDIIVAKKKTTRVRNRSNGSNKGTGIVDRHGVDAANVSASGQATSDENAGVGSEAALAASQKSGSPIDGDGETLASQSSGGTVPPSGSAPKVQKRNPNPDQGFNPVNFFKGIREELSKVVWPTRQQLLSESVAVVLMVTVSATVIYLVDNLFGWAATQVFR